jgi:hypothetical protein
VVEVVAERTTGACSSRACLEKTTGTVRGGGGKEEKRWARVDPEKMDWTWLLSFSLLLIFFSSFLLLQHTYREN